MFPLRNGAGELVAIDTRAIAPDARHKCISLGNKAGGVFATAGALKADPVAITEAPIDALTLAQAGLPAVALCGVSDGICWPDWLPARLMRRTVYLALDSDKAGQAAAARLRPVLEAYSADVRDLIPPEGVKDWNEALQRDGTIELPETTHQEAQPARAVPSEVSEDLRDPNRDHPQIRDALNAGARAREASELPPFLIEQREGDLRRGVQLRDAFYQDWAEILAHRDQGRISPEEASGRILRLLESESEYLMPGSAPIPPPPGPLPLMDEGDWIEIG